MDLTVGTGFVGFPSAQTSSAGEELISIPAGSTAIYLYRCNFVNTNACSVKLNGSSTAIYLAAGQGFSTVNGDAKISSFIIVENAIPFTFVGYY